MKATTRTEGILPALETAHAVAALPRLLAGIGGVGGSMAGRGPRAPRVLRPRRQGPGRARAVRRRRAVGERPVSSTTLDPIDRVRHERDGRRPADRGGLRAGEDGRPGRAHPVRRRRLSRTPRRASDRARGGRCRRRRARGRAAVFGPAGRRRDAPARVGRRAGRRGDARAFAPAHRADRGGPAGPADRADGLRQPGPRRRRRRGGGAAPGRRRCGRAHRRRPDARRGRAVRGRRPRRRAGGRLPRRPDDAAGPARRGRRPERRLPVLRVARRRDRRADVAAVDGRPPRPRRQRGLAGAGRGRVRRQPAGPRPGDREGRRRRRRSSPPPSSTRSGPTAATSTRWPGSSASCARRPRSA